MHCLLVVVGLLTSAQLATPSYVQLPDTPPKDNPATKALPSEKPLPSPPLAQLVTGSPVKEARCLLDASEKPLRRSPPGNPHQEEEWPVLFPEKPTTTATLRGIHSLDSPIPMLMSTSHDKERYPALANVEDRSAKIEHNPIKKSSSVQSIQRKPVPTNGYSENPIVLLSQHNPDVQGASTAGDTCHYSSASGASMITSDSRPLPDLSASAAAVEKSAQGSKKFPEPRPTRTSSLRARLSAGNLVTNTKVVGFTDFTTIREDSGKTEQGALRLPEDSRSRSKRPAVSAAQAKKSSIGPVRANRAPAKFVAGSRRPTAPQRPNSRGSLRGDAHAPNSTSGSRPPSRSAPDLPASAANKLEVAEGQKEQVEPAVPEQRRSSIPVFRGAVPSIVDHGEEETAIIKLTPTAAAESKHTLGNGFDIFENRNKVKTDARAASVVLDASSKRMYDQESLPKGKKAEEIPALEAITESPQSSYQTKRLSMASPDHGPTLRISPSAERFIMGEDLNKKNPHGLKNKQSKDLRRAVVTNELHKTTKPAELSPESSKHDERSHSSASLLQSASRAYIVEDEVEQKKENSINCSGPTSRLNADFPTRNNTKSSSNDDPFFDVQSHLYYHGNATTEVCPADAGVGADVEIPKNAQRTVTVDEDSWISPMPTQVSRTRLSDAMPVTPAFLPVSMQEHVSQPDCMQQDHSVPADSLVDLTRTIQRAQSSLEGKLNGAITPKELLFTPEHHGQGRPSTSPGDFPPRSSSRARAPDYTVNASANSSPVSPSDAGKHLSREFRTRQNKLGEEFGWGSEQLDFTNPNAKRESIARESNKSQGSYSKGVLSNFRGLFHKRSGNTPELRSSVKSTKKGKGRVSITSNGSPFPPISEVHPIHRPTLASTSKSRAATTISENTPRRPFDSPNRNNTTSRHTPRRSFESPNRKNTTNNATPAFQSPSPTEISTTTSLAMQILDSARRETSSPRKGRLLELGKIMVDAITQARDAEKAMEEAKQAARKAEVAYVLCKKSVRDVAKCVEEWGNDIGIGRS